MTAKYAWVEIAPGRKRLVDMTKPKALPPARSTLPFPMILRDNFDAPVQSMADGQYYDSKSSLYKTYRADGNPQGVEYECIGDAPIEPFKRPEKSHAQEAKTDEAISRALDEAGF